MLSSRNSIFRAFCYSSILKRSTEVQETYKSSQTNPNQSVRFSASFRVKSRLRSTNVRIFEQKKIFMLSGIQFDYSRILEVFAEGMSSGVKEGSRITSDKVTLTRDDERLKIGEQAERLESEVEEVEKEKKKKEDVKNTLKDFAYQMKDNIKDGKAGAKLDPVEKRKIEKMINKAIRLVGMKKKSATLEELEKQLVELEITCVPVIAKIYEESIIIESAPNMKEID